MIWQLDLLLLVVVAVTAVLALLVRDLLAAVTILTAYSLFAALLFAGMGAVDVALVEAVLGAGLTGVLFIGAVLATSRTTQGREQEAAGRRWTMIPIVAVFLALMVYASVGLPDRGDPRAPAHQRVAPEYLERSVDETRTPNVVTSLLADYRSHDTLGETLVIFTAALACALVMARRETE